MLVHSERSSSAGYEERSSGASTPTPVDAARYDVNSKSTTAAGAHGCSAGHKGDTLYGNPELAALASSVATVFTKSLLHPIDTLKCRVQLLRTDVAPPPLPRHSQRSLSYFTQGPPGVLRTRLGQLQHQYTGQWVPRHLYGGLPLKLFFYVPYQATYVSTYNFAQHTLQGADAEVVDNVGHRSSNYLWHTVAAAVFAEMVSATLRVPMETMKMRIQSTTATNSLHALRQLRQQGFASCVRLTVPQTLMHDIPYSVIQWVVYETLRPWTQRWRERAEASNGGVGLGDTLPVSTSFWALYVAELGRTFLSGGLSGMLASMLTAPLDNIRTRVVVATVHNSNLTVADVVRHTYRREGLRGFVRGGSLRIFWVTMNMACYFPLFEGVRSLLQRYATGSSSTGTSS
ncbi:hypothetical protein JKF63_04918 [Porcisia hertigi]|uniref:Mitochondrial carrier protein n=1 Tax=Porcisia hertigi TaxID=2761500 RepID=A0A836I4F9_9TRYP|nr:hypothetical protein JKF63_04918 [Porcisia hertigi]